MKKVASTALMLIVLSFVSLFAQVQLSDSAKISLLTTSPWTGAVYSLYGHTVIKVADDSTGVDACFNYGYFDSSQFGFLYHFLRGETDYILGATTYEVFISENELKGLEVVEQELNLSMQQKQQLWEDLYVNALPENRQYRYNFLFDNCATRPRDMVEQIIGKPISYPKTKPNQTFRNLIHECVHEFAWMQFGIDLIIGSGADRYITDKEKMFLPHYLMTAFEGAKVVQQDTIDIPLVKSTEVILESENVDNARSERGVLKPFWVSFALLIVTIIVSLFQLLFHQEKTARVYDFVLFLIAGVAGFVVTFLMFFSEHPVTNPNWNLAWLHVFHLFIAIIFWVKYLKKVVYYYHFINFAVLSLFLLSWYFIPQQLPWAAIPFVINLWMRSGANFFIQRKHFLKDKQFRSAKYMQAGWRR